MKTETLRNIATVAALTFAIGCSQQPAGEFADTVYTNGRIYTVDSAQPWAEAVAIKDGKFLVVGSAKQVEAVTGGNTAVVDLGGRFVMPGMIDVHTHGIENHLPSAIKLSDPSDVDAILAEVKAYVDAHPDQEWVTFVPFGFGLFPGDNGPKELLDEVAPNTAVAIEHQSGHAYWVNSKALELAGITSDTPDPFQGIITRKANGEPQGGLQESAMRLIRAMLPPTPEAAIRESTEIAMGQFAAHGITATREAGIKPDRFAVVKKMAEEGKLRTRFSIAAHWQTTLVDLPPSNEEVKEFLLENRDTGTDVLKLDSLKVYMDGVPASHTAAMKEPYTDRPNESGELLIGGDDLNATLIDYDKAGITAIIHTLGDRAMKVAQDAIGAAREANGDSGLRHHISHSIMIDSGDFDRFAEVDAVVDFSPFFAYPGPHHENHEKAVGKERLEQWYPVKSLMDRGVVVALATDYPVDQLNPFVHIESAHTRMHPFGDVPGTLGADEAISREAAIKAYTLNPAHILGWDDKIGSIEAGKFADMVVLDRNPFEVESSEISETRVLKTVFSGDVIHEATVSASSRLGSEAIRQLALARMQQNGHPCAAHNG